MNRALPYLMGWKKGGVHLVVNEARLFHLVDIQSNVNCLTLVLIFGYFGLILSDREKEETNSLVIACGEMEKVW